MADQQACKTTCKYASSRPYIYARAIAGAAKEQLWRSVPGCKNLRTASPFQVEPESAHETLTLPMEAHLT